MNGLLKWLTITLGVLLPWHGALTVFLPEPFRYWKEVIIIILAVICVYKFFRHKHVYLAHKKLKPSSLLYGLLFLMYGMLLVVLSDQKLAALMALRYVGTGIGLYVILSLIAIASPEYKNKVMNYFSLPFIYANIVSVLFGIWVKFGNGATALKNFYSQTISSWVPGQTLPIWHEAGEFVRMQGMSSGPIEFSHSLLISLFLTLISRLKNSYKILFSAIFLFGIYQSYSRAAVLGVVIILFFFFFQKYFFLVKKYKKTMIFSLIFIFFAGFWSLHHTSILDRAGTSDHFTRPVAALEFGIDNITSNNLGKIGPVARATNLRENNDDRAMIAENVFVDIFAQMGIIGVILYFLFFLFVIKTIDPSYYGLIMAFFIAMNLATIFDMMPLNLSFFMVLFFANKKHSSS